MKNKKEVLERLKDDEHYYGEYGRNFISNSDIRTLMTNPLEFKKPSPSAPHFLIGKKKMKGWAKRGEIKLYGEEK